MIGPEDFFSDGSDEGSNLSLARIHSAAVMGVDAIPVEVEVNVTPTQENKFQPNIVGLPDAAVKESLDRVSTALDNSGLGTPFAMRWLINLAPADLRKQGPSFDLPIALATLSALDELTQAQLDGSMAVGELALSGNLRPVRGVLPIALKAKEMGIRNLFVPEHNGEEAAVVEGLNVFPVKHLRDVVDFLKGDHELQALTLDLDRLFDQYQQYPLDFAEVKGQESARRSLEVAVAGGHNLLMIGSPGTGKSMIAKRIPTILPPLNLAESLEATKIHSIAGTLPAHQALVAQRAFRAPHHTVSDAGLLGGGTYPMPGEVSLAHHGVLFLDELPEFARNVLEVMRQPLEDGVVNISRAAASVTFPCRCMLVAAMNPCPCGYYGDPKRDCHCSPNQIQRYRNRVSGPLLDRIDIQIDVPAVRYEDLTSLEKGETSAEIRERVIRARKIQEERFADNPRIHCNANMGTKELNEVCRLDEQGHQMLRMAMDELHLSARAYDRILKVSRTLADLEESEDIQPNHLAEAIQYRSLDRQGWT
ncbi:YifB family Mg chelatase-like AAA ATPase [Kiritimatiellaeota bacterium B1221]|nr:YifB family Mg chelatase-like AAA ATPase [Kiritimatiellaeota bacterium B1221]